MPSPAVIVDPLEIRRGVDCGRLVTLVAGGVAVNLTGVTDISASLYAGTPDAPGSLVYAITLANGRLAVVSPATAGQVRMTLTGVMTATIAAGDYVQWFLVGDDYLPFIRHVTVKPSPLAP